MTNNLTGIQIQTDFYADELDELDVSKCLTLTLSQSDIYRLCDYIYLDQKATCPIKNVHHCVIYLRFMINLSKATQKHFHDFFNDSTGVNNDNNWKLYVTSDNTFMLLHRDIAIL